ncbi:MAG: hypothetical protein DCC49_08250 [Acidobacteria bacterium]|nr:MAG: hypothetical protein DCC49_08250 [Acidobacteriota bacterium]
MINACTIIARNYIAHARVLGASLEEHNPDSILHVLVVDDPDRKTQAPSQQTPANLEFLYPDELELDPARFLEMAATYSPLELCTALKPWLLGHLLAETAGHVIYLDPDIRVYAPLDELAELAEAHGVVLTPHVIEALPDDGKRPTETDIMAAGIFNLGFIGIGPGSDDFLKWWSDHLLRDCVVDPAGSVFVDQRWVDMAPSLFNAFICRDPAVNVAYWNLHERNLEVIGGRVHAAGHLLKFFHFSGYDPIDSHILSRHQAEQPRILLSEHPALEALCDDYGHELAARGNRSASLEPYGFSVTSAGLRIDHAMRRIYREALKRSDRDHSQAPPNPFEEPGESFTNWLNESAGGGMRTEITRYLHGLWELRSDLRQAFPDLSGPDAARYVEWARSAQRTDESLEPALIPRYETPASVPAPIWPEFAEPAQLKAGVNVAGYLNAELGIGAVARLAVAALEAGGVDCATSSRQTPTHRNSAPFVGREARFGDFDINLVCVNADRFTEFAHSVGPNFFDSRYTVGLWWWEIAEMPSAYRQAFDLVDEIWCGSDHVLDAIARATDKPVHKVLLPLALLGQPSDLTERKRGQSDDPFTFLFSFDFYSVVERKNPRGLIDAYTSAFGPDEQTRLIIKTIGGDRHVSDLESLKRYAKGRTDIEFRDEYLDSEANAALTASADCYVSLHRAEGLGLTMAEAMLAGVPVIATGYSGNLEFTSAETAWLVPYTLIKVAPRSGPYPAGSEWADPDLGAAARLMRQVFESPEAARERAALARRRLLEDFSLDRAARDFTSRIESIRGTRGSTAARRDRLDTTRRKLDGMARAESYLKRGPDLEVDSRFGEPGRLARRAVMRLLRSYSLYQGEVDRGLIDAIAELGERLHLSEARGDARLDEIASLQVELKALRSDLSAETSALDAALIQLTASLNPASPIAEGEAFVARDSTGEKYLGYDATSRLPTALTEEAPRQLEEMLRGSESANRKRLSRYVELLAGYAPVLDAGCGRGELLALLEENHVAAVGVDADASMIRASTNKGVKCDQGDVITYLDGIADGALGAVFSSGLVEYLNATELHELFSLGYSRIRDGGIFVVDTPNPHCPAVMNGFWSDRARVGPLYPEVGIALCRIHGFAEARVDFLPGTASLERDRQMAPRYVLTATKSASSDR